MGDFNKMFRHEFFKVYPADGFHTTNYTLVQKDRFGSYTRVLADFEFQKVDMSNAINMEEAFLSHPCLNDLDSWINCNENYYPKRDAEPYGRHISKYIGVKAPSTKYYG